MLADFIAHCSMKVARRLRATHPGGVVICNHTLTAEQLRFQIDVLGRWFEFIHHDDFLARLEQRSPRPFCLLTFDDGKRSNASEVAPELERLGVPAVFYVVTEFLSKGALLWFDRRDALIGALGHTPPALKLLTLKRLPLAELHDRLDRAFRRYRVAVDATSDDIRPMSWDDARDLACRGFTVGSHSERHAVLTNENENDALRDIEHSIARVTAETGVACRSFAFPNGGFTPRLALHAMRSGVQTVMTTDPMWVDHRFPAWRVPRVQLFGRQSRVAIELKLTAATSGPVLDNPDGTGRRYWRDFVRGNHEPGGAQSTL